MRRSIWLLAAALCACKSERTPAPDAGAITPSPPAIVVSAARSDLIFSYEAGREYRTAARIDEIPEDARERVVVTDLSLSPELRQADRYVYIADLRTPREDGTYPVALASRYAIAAPSGPAEAPAATPTKEVILYTTSWCGVCKRAKRVLSGWNVPFVEKDIEGSKKAADELAAKAAKAGLQMGGVPVIDVAGRLMQGLDEPSLEAACREAGLL